MRGIIILHIHARMDTKKRKKAELVVTRAKVSKQPVTPEMAEKKKEKSYRDKHEGKG